MYMTMNIHLADLCAVKKLTMHILVAELDLLKLRDTLIQLVIKTLCYSCLIGNSDSYCKISIQYSHIKHCLRLPYMDM